MRPTRLVVDLAAIAHNAARSQRAAGARVLCAVIKADAYGHGAVAVARALRACGVAYVAVALVEEARALRQAGVLGPLLVLGGDYRGDYDAIASLALTPMVGQAFEIDGLAEAAARQQKVLDVHLELDSGMSRLGAPLAHIKALAKRIASLASLRLVGLMTHLSHADVPNAPQSAQQLALFEQAKALVAPHAPALRAGHIVSSGALVTAPFLPHDWARCGLSLYGIEPLPDRPLGDLRPAARWLTRPIALRSLHPGQTVSYGGRWQASRPTLIATLPVGYADGYPRLCATHAHVLVRGQRAPVVGSICMDLCMVDVTDIEGVSLNDEVVLLGEQGDEAIEAVDLARWAQTIPYEILVGIGPRVRREYVGDVS